MSFSKYDREFARIIEENLSLKMKVPYSERFRIYAKIVELCDDVEKTNETYLNYIIRKEAYAGEEPEHIKMEDLTFRDFLRYFSGGFEVSYELVTDYLTYFIPLLRVSDIINDLNVLTQRAFFEKWSFILTGEEFNQSHINEYFLRNKKDDEGFEVLKVDYQIDIAFVDGSSLSWYDKGVDCDFYYPDEEREDENWLNVEFFNRKDNDFTIDAVDVRYDASRYQS